MIEKQIAKGVFDGIWRVIIVFAVGQIIMLVTFALTDIRRDTTDSPSSRSGLEIKTDCMTGLQYLTTASGGLTPRIGSDSKQMLEACK